MPEIVRTRRSDERGFTLIELLVVITVIGVLAAIALPNFLAQHQKAADADAKAMVHNAVISMETYLVEAGDYRASRAELLDIMPELADAGALTFTGDDDSYRVSVTSAAGRTFSVARLPGAGPVRDCAPTGGGCGDDGHW
jgi:type IV pilus assembly protein PilA